MTVRVEARFADEQEEEVSDFWHNDYYDFLVNHEFYLFEVPGVPAQAVLFGILFALFATPGVIPVPGAGHGFLAVVVPVWAAVAYLGVDAQWLAPQAAVIPMLGVFLAAASLYGYRHRAERAF